MYIKLTCRAIINVTHTLYVRKLSKSEFVKRSNKVHNNIYDYSKFEYVGIDTKGVIICGEHGEFLKSPWHHTKGQGCQKCSREALSIRYTKSKDTFVTQANKVHNYQYDYSEFEYIGDRVKSTIICSKHSRFQQAPGHHLEGTECPKCSIEEYAEKFRKSKEDFVAEANNVHNNKFDYSEFEYINCKIKGIIICNKHGKFEQSANNHLRGHACPHCTSFISKSETQWLDLLDISAENRNKTIRLNNRKVKPDAIVGNTVFEFYGDYWHANPSIYHGEVANKIHPSMKITFKEVYKRTQKREDSIKKAGYNLIIIWEHDWEIFKRNKMANQMASFLS